MSNKSKRHMQRVRDLGCVLCQHLGLGVTPAEVHHIGDTATRSDWLTVALCTEHHRGPTGFHGLGQRAFERRYKLTEWQLLALTMEWMA